MSRFSPMQLGCLLPFTLISNAALADLTPQQVWSDWRAYMEGVGYQIAATESQSGNALTVSDINLNFPLPESEGAMSVALGTISFAQNGDGSVAIVLPDSMPITMSGNTGEGEVEPFTATINVTQSNHAMTASGTPEKVTYLYTAQGLAVNLGQLQVGDEVLGAEFARVSLVGNNLSTSTTMTLGETRGYEQSGSVESLTYDLFINDPENNTQAASKGSVSGVNISGSGEIPLQIAPGADMAAMMAAGFDVAGRISFAAGNTEINVTDPDNGNVIMTTSSQGGDFGVRMGSGGLAYDVSQKNAAFNVTAQSMPFPIQINMAESGFKLAMPLAKSDTPQDFAFGLTLGDFTMSDMIWSIFDPTGQLPRDPATIALDLTGKVKILVDLMNPEAAAELTGAPGEMQALSLGNLLISAAGAKLQGTGDLTFDGAGPAMVPGLGNPVGNVNVDLAGANGLIDKLVAMGLLPQDQAMGARMMMGLFAVPGNAPDTLKSRIEFTQDGQILANGQRIR